MSFLEAAESKFSSAEREMLIQVIERELILLKFIADEYKTQDICKKSVGIKGWTFRFVPDH